MGFIIRGFIWDIPILIFAYVLFWGPIQRRKSWPNAKTNEKLPWRAWLPCSESKVVWISPALEELISDAIPSRSLLAIIAL